MRKEGYSETTIERYVGLLKELAKHRQHAGEDSSRFEDAIAQALDFLSFSTDGWDLATRIFEIGSKSKIFRAEAQDN